jgi:hypothetical protein
MPPILIAEATAGCVRLALFRQRCHAICHALPPYADSPAEVRSVARSLGRTLDPLTILRGGRRPEEIGRWRSGWRRRWGGVEREVTR